MNCPARQAEFPLLRGLPVNTVIFILFVFLFPLSMCLKACTSPVPPTALRAASADFLRKSRRYMVRAVLFLTG